MAEAMILVKRHELPMGRHYLTFEWHGSRYGVFRVRRDLWPKLKREAPWPLRVVKEDLQYDQVDVVRADGASWLSWLWHSVAAWVSQQFRAFKCRLILTAMVWGLAWVDPGSEPAWSDLGRSRLGV